jgi:hypothetical protein
MLDVLFKPNKFFTRKREEEVRSGRAILIVFAFGIVAAMNPPFLGITGIIRSMGGGVEPINIVGVMGVIIGNFMRAILIVLSWLVMAAIVYGVSAIFHGKGEFDKTVEFTSYGFIPLIFAELITLGLIWYAISPILPFLLENPSTIEEMIELTLQKSPLTVLLNFFLTFFFIWFGYIEIFAIKNARDLSTRNATFTGIVMVVMLALLACLTSPFDLFG